MANENSSNIVPPTVVVPSGYSNSPLVGKIQQLYDANNNNLYKKLSPYTENSGLLSFGPRQPYVYVNPNQGRKGINGLKRFESRIFPIGSALQDVQRIAKFSITGNGILFLTKQFALQRFNAFNETRIYNPLSVINAVVRPVTAFILPVPTRHLSGGLLGALSSLVGINVSSDKPIKGTVAEKNSDVIPKFEQNVHINRYGKGFSGLIRGGTAASAYYVKKPSSFGGLINFAKKLFGGTVKQPPGTKFRADEAYSVFDLKTKKEFGSLGASGKLNELHQRWYNDKDSSGAVIKDPGNEHRLKFPKEVAWDDFADASDRFNGEEIGGELKAKYGDTVYPSNSLPYARSDIILIYKRFVERSDAGSRLYNKFPRNIKSEGKGFSGISDQDGKYKIFPGKGIQDVSGSYSYEKRKDPLSGVYTLHGSGSATGLSGRLGENIISGSGIDATGNQISVRGTVANNKHKEKLVNSLNSLLKNLNGYNTSDWKSGVDITYNSLINRKNNQPGRSTVNGYENSVSSSRRIDKSKGIESNKPDRINSLFILKRGDDDNGTLTVSADPDQTYSPYEDDFIAFYFHDLVNDTYIPFRATVKGINESATANWSEISYIGRSDKLFNYTGFSRSLSFNFKVVAMSIKELLPMWKRINYLVGLTKPAGYTDYKSDEVVSKFIIPPLVNITIGDLYKEQPVVLKSVTISIPEDAIWELTPELNNASENKEWKYLNDKIVWKNSGGKYAQFPTECDIQISTDILETERPRTGGRNFGGGSNSNGGFSKQLIVA